MAQSAGPFRLSGSGWTVKNETLGSVLFRELPLQPEFHVRRHVREVDAGRRVWRLLLGEVLVPELAYPVVVDDVVVGR